MQYLRPAVRALLLKIACGERIPPEFVRIVLAGCLKGASLRAVVKTIPTKEKGLRIQTSDIILGEPGVGKGQSFQWRDDLIDEVKKMLLEYADTQLQLAREADNAPLPQGLERPRVKPVKTFKYVDGIERLSNMDLPFLVDLPNGSCEAVFVTASRNSGSGLVPILE